MSNWLWAIGDWLWVGMCDCTIIYLLALPGRNPNYLNQITVFLVGIVQISRAQRVGGYIPCICAHPCLSVGSNISPCPAGRNLINLGPRLSCAFSQFSETNCLTLSLAMLARYLNTQFMNLVMRHCRYPCLLADCPFPARGSVLTQMPKADAGAVRSSAGQNRHPRPGGREVRRKVRRTSKIVRRTLKSIWCDGLPKQDVR